MSCLRFCVQLSFVALSVGSFYRPCDHVACETCGGSGACIKEMM